MVLSILLLCPSFFLPLFFHQKNSINKPQNFTSTQTHINPSPFLAFVDRSKQTWSLNQSLQTRFSSVRSKSSFSLSWRWQALNPSFHGSSNSSFDVGFGLIWFIQIGFPLDFVLGYFEFDLWWVFKFVWVNFFYFFFLPFFYGLKREREGKRMI